MTTKLALKRSTPEFQAALKTYRINLDEYNRITELLGRDPIGVEWALFSALWSEHCSYKSSKVHLKKLFNQSPRVVQSFGENAGVIDLGDGERVAFKMESHNHPSFIEPYQGAATGVGGILRDIFTMGARPIALANYLCFGDPKAPRMSRLVDGVVRGIGGYGNCVGVPTVTGQTEFDASYDQNILVNAMAVGLFRKGEKVFLSKASGVGNWVVYVGSKTGRDGVHGASMASESFDDNSAAKRPTVQIGDPFFEKLLIESCLEVMRENLVVAIQDMGAAGLTSSSFEMAAKGEVGFKLELDKVPLRDSTMQPEEILLSESQERMLLICEPSQFAKLQEVFNRWGLDAAKIGHITEGRDVQLWWHGELLTSIDPALLVEDAPQYNRPWQNYRAKNRCEPTSVDALTTVEESKASHELLRCLRNVRGTSREFIYRQYDSRVGAATARDCRDSVAVVRLPDSGKALGIVLGARPHVLRWDAKVGGADAVAYPALELAAKGFETLAVTDCLNFGNPEKENVMTDFVASLGGMNEVCARLVAPIISGNVSFYNETKGENITPTPSTGLVGLRRDLKNIPESQFNDSGLAVFLVRVPLFTLGGAHSEMAGQPVRGTGLWRSDDVTSQSTAALVASFVDHVKTLAAHEGVRATRVVGKFGLSYALARLSLGGVGAEIDAQALSKARGVEKLSAAHLFEEHLYEVIFAVDVKAADTQATDAFAARFNHVSGAVDSAKTTISITRIGATKVGELKIANLVHLPVSQISDAYHSGWSENFESLA